MDKQQILRSVISRRQSNGKDGTVKIGRKSIFERCKDCGERYNIVKVYLPFKNGIKTYRAGDQHVCFECGWMESPDQYDFSTC